MPRVLSFLIKAAAARGHHPSICWAHGLRFPLPLELLEPKKFLPLGAPDGAE